GCPEGAALGMGPPRFAVYPLYRTVARQFPVQFSLAAVVLARARPARRRGDRMAAGRKRRRPDVDAEFRHLGGRPSRWRLAVELAARFRSDLDHPLTRP